MELSPSLLPLLPLYLPLLTFDLPRSPSQDVQTRSDEPIFVRPPALSDVLPVWPVQRRGNTDDGK